MYGVWDPEQKNYRYCDLIIPDHWGLDKIRAFLNWQLANLHVLEYHWRYGRGIYGFPEEFWEMVRWVPEDDERMARGRA